MKRKVEVGGGDGFANDVFSAGFLVKGLLIYMLYTHWCNSLERRLVEDEKIENLNHRCCGIVTQQRVIEYLKISKQYNNIRLILIPTIV